MSAERQLTGSPLLRPLPLTGIRVAFVLNAPTDGGIARTSLQRATDLAALGATTTFVFGNFQGSLRQAFLSTGLPYVDLKSRIYDPRFAVRLRWAVNGRQDVIISEGSWLNVIAGSLRRFGLLSPRVVGIEHTELKVDSYHPRWGRLRPLLHWGCAWLQRRFLSSLDECLAVSETLAATLRTEGLHPRALALANGFDFPGLDLRAGKRLDYPGWPEHGPIIVAAGRLVPQKNFGLLFDALALSRSGAALVLFGSGPEESALRKRAAALNLEKRIRFLGYHENLLPAMKRADLVVSSSNAEALPTVLIEALAAGARVVATDCAHGPREILRDGQWGMLTPPGDAQALALAIDASLAKPRPGSEVRQDLVARYGNQRVAERLADVVRSAPRHRVFGCWVDALTMNETVERIASFVSAAKPRIQISINVSKATMADRDPAFAMLADQFDLANADGMPIVTFAPLFGVRLPERVPGIDLMTRLLQRAAEEGWGVYLLGASSEAVEAMLPRLRQNYPSLRIVGARDGFWTLDAESAVVDAVASSRPDLLFVALGSPRQEKFLLKWKDRLAVPFAMGVGGSFDVLSGMKARAPVFMQRAGIEWVHRFLLSPRYMARRIFLDGGRFSRMMIRQLRRRLIGR